MFLLGAAAHHVREAVTIPIRVGQAFIHYPGDEVHPVLLQLEVGGRRVKGVAAFAQRKPPQDVLFPGHQLSQRGSVDFRARGGPAIGQRDGLGPKFHQILSGSIGDGFEFLAEAVQIARQKAHERRLVIRRL